MKRPDFSKIKTATIRGKVFKAVWRKPRNTCPDSSKEDVGKCDHPETLRKELWVWPRQDFWEFLETIIHECIHAALPDLDEDCVNELARDIVRLLRRMGLRGMFHPK